MVRKKENNHVSVIQNTQAFCFQSRCKKSPEVRHVSKRGSGLGSLPGPLLLLGTHVSPGRGQGAFPEPLTKERKDVTHFQPHPQENPCGAEEDEMTMDSVTPHGNLGNTGHERNNVN